MGGEQTCVQMATVWCVLGHLGDVVKRRQGQQPDGEQRRDDARVQQSARHFGEAAEIPAHGLRDRFVDRERERGRSERPAGWTRRS